MKRKLYQNVKAGRLYVHGDAICTCHFSFYLSRKFISLRMFTSNLYCPEKFKKENFIIWTRTKKEESEEKIYQYQFLLNFFFLQKLQSTVKVLYQMLKKLFLQLILVFQIPTDYSNKIIFRLWYHIIFIYQNLLLYNYYYILEKYILNTEI